MHHERVHPVVPNHRSWTYNVLQTRLEQHIATLASEIASLEDAISQRDAANKKTPGIYDASVKIELGVDEEADRELVAKHDAAVGSGAIAWPALMIALRDSLVALGQNPV